MLDTLTNDTLMTDTVAIQERIGELCHQFRLPTMGAQSVSRFTAAGHGDALETLLEVLEQEAEDRRQRRISRLRTASRLPAGKTWETFEHDRVPLSLQTATGRTGRRQLRRPRRQRPGLRSSRHRENTRPVRLGPPAGGSRTLGALCPGLPAGAGPARCQAGPGATATTTKARQLRLPAAGRPGVPAPRGRGVRGALHAHRRTLRTPVPGHHVQPGSSPSGSTSSPTQWPRRRPSTGWSTTRSSWNSTCPATAPEWPSSAVRNGG